MLCMSLPPLIEALQTVAEAGLDLLGAQRRNGRSLSLDFGSQQS